MAITATFYQIIKDRNSTALPSGSGDSFEIRLKDSCSFLSPALIMDYGLDGNPTAYNYCYIPDFGRYYWITDWTADRGLWVASCSVDALTSWRDYIGSSIQYIARAAAEYDGKISDAMYPAKTGPVVTNTELVTQDGTSWTDNLLTGTFVLGIIGSGASELGAVSYYAMTPAQFRAFSEAMLGSIDTYGSDWGEGIALDFAKSLFNPSQYIKSCMWFPFQIVASPVSGIPFGWWVLQCDASLITTYKHTDIFSATVPQHPQAASRGTYLNSEPYRRLTLYAMPFGTIPIPSGEIGNTISVTVYTDLVSGQGIAYVFGQSGGALPSPILLSQHSAQVGVPIGYAQISGNLLETASAIGSAAASVASSNALGVAYGVATATESLSGRLKGGGSNGSLAAYGGYMRLKSECYSICDELLEDIGRPLMSPRTVSTLTGFLQTERAHIEAPATSQEIRTIEDALNSGIFWE